MKKNRLTDVIIKSPGITKLFLIMKLTFLLSVICVFTVSASGYSQNTKLSLDLKDVTLKEALEDIESQTEFSFIYKSDLINPSQKVDIQVTGVRIEEVLNKMFSGRNIRSEILDNSLIVLLPDNVMEQQQQKITGTVTDASTGEALPGVNVLIEGSQTGAITDSDGKFVLQISAPNAVLVFSYIGYKTTNFSYSGQTVIDIKLDPDFQILEEIVVVGYGSLQKKDLTSAISNVTSDDFVQGSTNSVAGLIQGKVAGLSVNTVQADPSQEATLQIRGIGSLNASNEPLVVIDGVPGASLNSVAQQDIESFSVLKDGAA
jgi:iron complex outermembrane receptor protein